VLPSGVSGSANFQARQSDPICRKTASTSAAVFCEFRTNLVFDFRSISLASATHFAFGRQQQSCTILRLAGRSTQPFSSRATLPRDALRDFWEMLTANLTG
jgi:hypothetical protein